MFLFVCQSQTIQLQAAQPEPKVEPTVQEVSQGVEEGLTETQVEGEAVPESVQQETVAADQQALAAQAQPAPLTPVKVHQFVLCIMVVNCTFELPFLSFLSYVLF